MQESSQIPSLAAIPPAPEAGPGGASGDQSEADVLDLAALLERSVLIALGAASLATSAVAAVIERSVGADEGSPFADGPAIGLPITPWGLIGLAERGGRIALRVGLTATRTAFGIASMATSMIVGTRFLPLEERLATIDDDGQTRRVEAETAATVFADVLFPRILDAVIDRVDLTELVTERVDLDQVAGRVDVERILQRVEPDSIVERVNLDRIVERVDIEAVIKRVDVEAIVARLPLDEIAARLDVDAVAARLDLEAVIARLDLAGIALSVIEEIDLPEIIRESTGTMSSEAVDSVRARGIDADRVLARWRERLLARDGTSAPSEPRDGTDEAT